MTIIMSCIVVGQMASMTPDYSEAKRATNKVFRFLEKIPNIDSYSDSGLHPVR